MTRKQAEQIGPAEARKIVQLRDRDGMSFAAIGLRFGVNPRGVVYHYRKIKGLLDSEVSSGRTAPGQLRASSRDGGQQE